MEFVMAGHFIVLFITQTQDSDYYNKAIELAIYDSIGSGIIFMMVIYDTVTSTYKWYYWSKTGKIPFKFSFLTRKIHVKKGNLDTSQIGLLENNQSQIISPVKGYITKTNTFMDAMN